ncbi:TPA_asm: HAD-IA family hydrolase [Salmonella enterica subsp. enterica serovar Montevideo]|jgi:FMN phosphatase YigB (HAD superfamily)|uniref:phosphoglycolate phosphatase n=34 Tax=Enterobacterales TaxID=91347 RepID=A0ABD5C4U1_ECOLX|nr:MULTISPECIES: HAD-IA family hydrolase [Enterobacterales]AVO83792.1 haloacid dehalogenase [Enterobacter cloacae complex sp.]EBO3099535.1 HAD-IA family hydrolase [Salmonella enterica subsp. enterica serovar Tennessee]ECN6463129.1 HAD-IA family hydrolase [Salmonella enterica subsp. enterica serovar Typhimurium]ECS7735611.1 HAD family hydrolase [Salmonella enterica subsp. enterica serovar Montevideo str. FSL_R8-4673]ECV1192645.1 HAD family hydrolase [Salmonella enterica subsp. enterica]EDC9679
MKLLITDLDNTLYDWVSFYSQSFSAMAEELSKEINVPLDILLSEYKVIHQRFGNSEKPFATLELPSVISYFGTNDKILLQKKLTRVFSAFSSKRNHTLKLYPTVRDTLNILRERGVKIVGHTESLEYNSLYRLYKLDVIDFFDHLYTIEDNHNLHPNPKNAKVISVKDDFIIRLSSAESKPNPKLLEHICLTENVDIKDAVYVGDSITKDISMAKSIGMKAVWARYGRQFAPELWEILVKITHWTDKDVEREEQLKESFSRVKPDYSINSFAEILDLM